MPTTATKLSARPRGDETNQKPSQQDPDRQRVAPINRLVISDLAADRGSTPVFSGLNLTLTSGDLVQVLGANGSGKSTLLRVIIGLLPAEAGSIFWNDIDIQTAAKTTFQSASIYLGHKNAVAEDLTAIENLDYFLHTRGAAPICSAKEALQMVGFSASPRQIAGKLSAGQKQRLALAKLALVKSNLWLLDEPLTALDSEAKLITERMLDRHCKTGGIAIIATHQEISSNSGRMRQLVLS